MKINLGLIILIAALGVGCGGGGGGGSSGGGSSSSGAMLVSIAVNPVNPSIAVGTTQQLTATGIFSDNSTQDLTTSVTWSSSATSIATIGSGGKAASIAAGTTTITAASGGISGSTELTVTSATLVSIAVNPTNPSIAAGTAQQFTATGIFSDNSKQDITTAVIWNSSSTSVATISNVQGYDGKATSSGVGSTSITASLNGVSASTILSVTPATLVSVAVTPSNPSIPLGPAQQPTTEQFKATGTFSDGSTQDLTTSVTWNSSATSIATISSAGMATSLGLGTTTITATYGSGSSAISGSTTLTVTRATLTSITLTSSVPAPGVAPTPVAAANIPIGFTQQYYAIGSYSDGTYQNLTSSVTWSSSSPSVAAIAGTQGIATSLAAGTTTITATYGSGSSAIFGSAALTVNSTYLVQIKVSSAAGTSINVGAVQPFTATGVFSDGSTRPITSIVVWASSSTSVATVSNAAGSNGYVTAVAVGTATITATYGSITGSVAITVLTPVPVTLTSIVVFAGSSSAPLYNPTIVVGSTIQCFATATYSDGTTQNVTDSATWSTSSTLVATVTNGTAGGLVTAIGTGTATITATYGTITTSSGTEPGAGSIPLTVATYPAGTYQVGVNPSGIAIDASGDVWITNSGGSSVTGLLSTGSNWMLGNTYTTGTSSNKGSNSAGVSPFGIAIDYASDIWLTNYDSGTVTVIDLNAAPYSDTCTTAPLNSTGGVFIKRFPTTTTPGTGPHGLAIDSGLFTPRESFNVWVANYGTTAAPGNTVTMYTATLSFCAGYDDPSNISVSPDAGVSYTVGNNPDSIAIDSVGNVWVTNWLDSTVTELSSSGTLINTYPTCNTQTCQAPACICTGPRGIAIDPSGNVWVANAGSDAAPGNTVTELNSSGSVLGIFPVGTGPRGIAIETAGNVWVSNYGTTTTPGTTVTQLCGAAAAAANSVVNGVTCKSTGQQVQTFQVGNNPDGIGIDFSGNVWVTNYYDNTVTELQGKTKGPHYSPYSGPIWP